MDPTRFALLKKGESVEVNAPSGWKEAILKNEPDPGLVDGEGSRELELPNGSRMIIDNTDVVKEDVRE